jgi:hypothetical protein
MSKLGKQVIASRASNKRLAPLRQTEIRLRVYHDQYDLLTEWSEANKLSNSKVIRALIDYFLHMNESTRIKIIIGK